MQPQQAFVARSRKAQERDLMQRTLVQAPPHKERALWNFLTWSFFIAQVLAAEQFVGAQAKAAEGLDLKASDATAALASPLEALAAADGTGNAMEDVPSSLGASLDDVFAPFLKLGNFDGSVIDLDSIARSEDQSIAIAAYGVGASSEPSSPGDGLVSDPVVDVVIPDILDVIGDATGPLLNTVEDIVATLTQIVGGITDPLSGTVGNVAHVLDDIVHDVLAPVTDLVADLTQPLDDVLASAGQLSFPVLGLLGELDELFKNGRYTDYNIELQSSLPGASATTSADPITSVTTATADVVDHVVDTAARPLAHLLDDLGSRDGLL
ncbi:MAG: hypothetical protein ACKVP3_27725 [Hyphomicrobiaceae bacterium]